jgi:hypothetical protein
MSIFPGRKKRAAQLPRQLALGRLDDAIGRAEDTRTFADRCRHVRTGQGRKAHLEDPERPGSGALCEWPGALLAADPALPVCQLCKVAAGIADERRAS